jgi:hypothetical protein
MLVWRHVFFEPKEANASFHLSYVQELAVSPPRRAKERARFLSDFAVTTKRTSAAVYFTAHATFGSCNRAPRNSPRLRKSTLHDTKRLLLAPERIVCTKNPVRDFAAVVVLEERDLPEAYMGAVSAKGIARLRDCCIFFIYVGILF